MTGVSRVVQGLVVVVCGALMLGCTARAEVAIEVRPDGSGTVGLRLHFDAGAVARVPDLARGLPLDDLRDAGWEVVTENDANGVTFSATKPFAGGDELAAVLTELTGPDGFLRDVTLERDRSFGEVRWRFGATADLSRGLVGLGDEQLTALLGGAPIGRDPNALEKELGVAPADATAISLVLRLPGDADVVAPGARTLGPAAQWDLRLGDAPRELRATVNDPVSTAWLWAVVAGAATFALVVLVVVRGLRRRPPILRAVDGGA